MVNGVLPAAAWIIKIRIETQPLDLWSGVAVTLTRVLLEGGGGGG